MSFSTIAVKLVWLIMSKNKIRNQKYLPANLIFLKVVVSNIRDAFGANHFTS